MGQIISFLIGKIGFDFLIKTAYVGIMIIYITFIIAIYASLVVGFFYFYNLIQTFVTMASGSGLGSGLEFVDYMYGLLDCIGFTSALNDSLSLLVGGVTFIMGRIIAQVSVVAYKSLILAITPLLSK